MKIVSTPYTLYNRDIRDPLIRELYEEYKMIEVPVKRMINCDAKGRMGREVIVTNEVRV